MMSLKGGLTSIRSTSNWAYVFTPIMEGLLPCFTIGDRAGETDSIISSRQPYSQQLLHLCSDHGLLSRHKDHRIRADSRENGQCKFTSSAAAAAALHRKSASQQSKRSGPKARADAIAPASAPESELASAADPWTEVVQQGTGQIYYWNEQTNETTAIGEPKPGPLGRVQNPPRTINQGTSLLGLVGVGAGVGLTFAILGRLM